MWQEMFLVEMFPAIQHARQKHVEPQEKSRFSIDFHRKNTYTPSTALIWEIKMERIEFEILSSIAEKRDIGLTADTYRYQLSELNAAREKLENSGLIADGEITEAGMASLEPYKVQRAVFLAAGFGSRMVPITINTPKPMVRVHGKRIIETLIEAVLDAGIEEIYIVRGYLGEQFELLQKKYPMIKLIENPEYDGTGTISSFYYARNLLDRAYVMESDLVVSNPKVVHRYHYTSDFMGTRVNQTDDWFIKTDENGMITEIGIGGEGERCYKLIGMSYWDGRDGRELAHDIKEAYEGPEGRKLPMSFVPFRVYRDKYKINIMPCNASDVIEIDSFAELQEFDEIYKNH